MTTRRLRTLTFSTLVAGLAAIASADHIQPLGDDFQVNDYTTGDQVGSAVAVAQDGSFVLVWESEQPGGAYTEVMARRFDVDGTPGAELQVNTYTRGYQREADVVAGSDGFFVVWKTNLDGDDSGDSLLGRRLDASGRGSRRRMCGASFMSNELTHATRSCQMS